MNIIIIGTGNAATVLGKLFVSRGHNVLQVFGRSESSASTLARELDSDYTSLSNAVHKGADMYLLAISDRALTEGIQGLDLAGEFVVHCAGSVPMSVLDRYSRFHGVLYPLQSLSRSVSALPNIPFFIDASSVELKDRLTIFARGLSGLVDMADDTKRAKLHLAAVIVNNFPNFLYTLAAEFCEKEGLPFESLQPLLVHSVQRLEDHNPSEMQTGPAIRHDLQTIENHLALLQDHDQLYHFYNFFSVAITSYFK